MSEKEIHALPTEIYLVHDACEEELLEPVPLESIPLVQHNKDNMPVKIYALPTNIKLDRSDTGRTWTIEQMQAICNHINELVNRDQAFVYISAGAFLIQTEVRDEEKRGKVTGCYINGENEIYITFYLSDMNYMTSLAVYDTGSGKGAVNSIAPIMDGNLDSDGNLIGDEIYIKGFCLYHNPKLEISPGIP